MLPTGPATQQILIKIWLVMSWSSFRRYHHCMYYGDVYTVDRFTCLKQNCRKEQLEIHKVILKNRDIEISLDIFVKNKKWATVREMSKWHPFFLVVSFTKDKPANKY